MAGIKALNRRFNEEVIEKGNFNLIGELIAEDFVEHQPLPGTAQGREGVKQTMVMVRSAFPDVRIAVEADVAEGDMLFAMGTMTGTHQGEFMGIPATGKAISVLFMDLFRVRDGKFVEHWALFDTAAMMEQLGVQPPG